MILNDAIQEIIDNVQAVSTELDQENIEEMLKILRSCENVFLLGLGSWIVFWAQLQIVKRGAVSFLVR